MTRRLTYDGYAGRCKIPDCCRLDLSGQGETMCALVDAMCYMENGERIPMEDIEAGWELM